MLSKRITYLRQEAKMNQKELAQKLNLSPSAIGMYELGKRIPSLDVLIDLSDIFEVSLDYLITGSNYSRDNPKKGCPCESCYWR